MSAPKEYLGDGVYASFDGYQIWLTAENGICATDSIALEPDVLNSLNRFAQKINGTTEDAESE